MNIVGFNPIVVFPFLVFHIKNLVLWICGLFVACLCSFLLCITNQWIKNKFVDFNSNRSLIDPPLLVIPDSNNWYQSLIPLRKLNHFRKI